MPSVPQPDGGRGAVAWPVRLTWMVVGAAFALAGVAAIKVYRNAATAKTGIVAAEMTVALPVPVGESFDGYVLPDGDDRVARNPTDLTLRRICAWGVPGRSPYQGTVTQALAAAGLPEEVVGKIDAMVEHHIVSDRVEIRKDSIQTASGKRRFGTTLVAMGFGTTLCFGTRVNFQPGHVEMANLYDATDAKGTNFAVMVPHVCGNVSVLAERGERTDGGGGNGGSTVPEPGTLVLLVVGLIVMAVRARGVRRRRHNDGSAAR